MKSHVRNQIFGTFVLLLVLLSVFPNLATALVAVLFAFTLLVLALGLLGLAGRGLAILGLEIAVFRWLYKRR